MNIRIMTIIGVFACLFICSASIRADGDPPPGQDIQLSPELLDLLRAEMREISTGIQGIAVSLATADWGSVKQTSAKISASYIMKQSLTPAQANELKQALPEQFKLLDAEFHRRADRLGAAAEAHNAELAAFHYSRLVGSCAHCHAKFASQRFPGFTRAHEKEHHH